MPKETGNNAIDLMKFISALMIISIHTQPLLSVNTTANFILVEILSRIAVPYFYISSGYFFFSKIIINHGIIGKCEDNKNRLLIYIKRLLIMYFFWTVIYLFWWIPFWYFRGFLTASNLKGYILSIFISGSYYHLWYIVSLVYGLIFTYGLLRLAKLKSVVVIAILFYIIGTLQYSYAWVFKGNSVFNVLSSIYTASSAISIGIFRAFPYLVAGCLFAKWNIRINHNLKYFLTVISIVCTGLEVWFLKSFTDNINRFSYVLFTGISALFIFYVSKNMHMRNHKIYLILRNMSIIVYFIHPMLINLTRIVFGGEPSSIVLFSIVTGFSLAISYVIVHLSRKVNILQYIF